MVQSYKVFQIQDTNAVGARINGLIEATHRSFDNIGAAEDWIRTEGNRQVDYVILEVYRKP